MLTASASATKLFQRVVGWQAAFTVGSALAIAALSPFFLLLSGGVAIQGSVSLAVAVLAGGGIAILRSWWLVRKRRFLLRSLTLRLSTIEPNELVQLNDDAWRIAGGWLLSMLISVGLFTTIWRPDIVPPTTAVLLFLLGAIILAAAALPLLVLVRAAFLRALELAPPEIMREIILSAERAGRLRGRVSRRLIAALSMPVLFLSIGSALIANAHLREADEREREETARVFVRAALENLSATHWPEAGLEEALSLGEALGFDARLRPFTTGYEVRRGDRGIVTVIAPLDHGSAEVKFGDSTVSVLDMEPLLIALLAVTLAAMSGVWMGRALSRDLKNADRGVRFLGTEAVMKGSGRIMPAARFIAVAQLGRAIELLARRFRIFTRAQERSIAARHKAARMRGLFFASVSHDLKSPLNAILGFAELVRQSEPLTLGQSESLELIVKRGRELLALIETILDAARVEAGQLTLVQTHENVRDLLALAIEKGKDLGGDNPTAVIVHVDEHTPQVVVDRVRLPQALATLIGHAVRMAERPSLRVRAGRDRAQMVRIEVELASQRFTAHQLDAMLNPERQPGQHRGLALGLRLARSIFELHGGGVRVETFSDRPMVFAASLPPAKS